jgi:TatD DNase family protein
MSPIELKRMRRILGIGSNYGVKVKLFVFTFAAGMIFIDTHTHLYLDAFDRDRAQAIESALSQGVQAMLLPNIDSSTIEAMQSLSRAWPGHCYSMMGLHPTSVKADYERELQIVEEQLDQEQFVAVGEIGIDLYWDRTYEREQETAFRRQVELALHFDLPVVIHSRNSIDRIITLLQEINNPSLKGVFHCFGGSTGQAEQITGMGFYLGIGGVLTYPKSGLGRAIEPIGLRHLLLETDAPFLPPVPYRGQRNESAYIPLIAKHLSELFKTDMSEVAEMTTANAKQLFKLNGISS